MQNSSYITEERMLIALREVYSQVPDEKLGVRLKEALADPVSPVTPGGRVRISPTVLLIVIVFLATVGVLLALGLER